MAWVAPAIAAGSGIGGGLIARDANRREARRQYEQQKEFAQHGIQWRVADAKAAGLHPLFAMGAQLPSYSPVVMGDTVGPALAEAGQDVSRAIQATETSQQREARALGLQLLRSQIAETDARKLLLDSERMRNEQGKVQAAPFPNVGMPQPMDNQGVVMPEGQAPGSYAGLVNVKPADLPITKVGDPSTVAGDPGMWRAFTLRDGRKIFLPGGTGGDPNEALESLGENWLAAYAVYRENIARQGPDWGRWFARNYLPGGKLLQDLEEMWNTITIKHEAEAKQNPSKFMNFQYSRDK